MASDSKTRQTLRREDNGGDRMDIRVSAPGFVQIASSMLTAQQQMLEAMSLTAEAMRFAARRMQVQMGYLNALSQCRDLHRLVDINAEFARRVADETTDELAEMAKLTEHWLSGQQHLLKPSSSAHR
jgi:hypothetical protein